MQRWASKHCHSLILRQNGCMSSISRTPVRFQSLLRKPKLFARIPSPGTRLLHIGKYRIWPKHIKLDFNWNTELRRIFFSTPARVCLSYSALGLGGSFALGYASMRLYYALSLENYGSPCSNFLLSYPSLRHGIDSYAHLCESLVRMSRTITVFGYLYFNYQSHAFYYHWLRPGFFPSRFQLSDDKVKLRLNTLHQQSANRILNLCIRNGGLYVKAGQALAACIGILPGIYCQTMSILQDQVPSLPFEVMANLFIEEFGQPVEVLFDSFDTTPVASASLAQVYKAIYQGQKVAVKVQYPSVKHYYRIDLLTQRILIRTLGFLQRESFDMDAVITLQEQMKKEMDFNLEARNMIRVRKNFEQSPDVYVPYMIPERSTDRIITMEYIDGVKVTNVNSLQQIYHFKLDDIARKLFQAFSEQIFLHGFIHADPHPANIFVRQSPYMDTPHAQIVLLDHGLYQEIGDEFRLGLSRFYEALVFNDKQYMRKYCEMYGIPDYEIYASVLLMQTYNGSLLNDESSERFEMLIKNPSDFLSFLSDEEKAILEKNYLAYQDVCQQIPTQMWLILRNQFILQYVNYALGAPVNKFTIQARTAVKGLSVLTGNMDASKSHIGRRGALLRYIHTKRDKKKQMQGLIEYKETVENASVENPQYTSYMIPHTEYSSRIQCWIHQFVFEVRLQLLVCVTWFASVFFDLAIWAHRRNLL